MVCGQTPPIGRLQALLAASIVCRTPDCRPPSVCAVGVIDAIVAPFSPSCAVRIRVAPARTHHASVRAVRRAAVKCVLAMQGVLTSSAVAVNILNGPAMHQNVTYVTRRGTYMPLWQMLKCAVAAVALIATGCGGGGGGPQSINATVHVSWTPNREAAVNTTGGGYRVYYSRTSGFDIAGADFVDVPFVALVPPVPTPPPAPTTTALTLSSGTNFIKVVAYSALNPNGSAPSAQVSVSVPFASASAARHD